MLVCRRSDVTGVGICVEVWCVGADPASAVRFTWPRLRGPAHVELSAYVRHGRDAALALQRVFELLERYRMRNPTPGQLQRLCSSRREAVRPVITRAS